MSKKVTTVFGWIVTVFCILAALVYMPSFASILFLIVGVGCLPIQPIRKLWNQLPFAPKVIKGIVLTVLFFVACGITPSVEKPTNVEVVQVSETTTNDDAEVIAASSHSDESENSLQTERPVQEKTETSIEENSEEKATIANAEEAKSQEPVIVPIVEEKVIATPEETAKVEGFDIKSIPAYSGSPYVAVNDNVPFFTEEELSTNSYEYYSSLDSKGRCGVCVASVGTDIMPTEERGEIGSVKPSGWKQAKYAGLVDGNYLYNRCHLIGYQLTGENANTKNLITGTRYLNIEGMLPFENMVADYVTETKNHVMYRVSPIFEGNNLLASGVLMEAKSVEDNGEGILFCVYCYNVQPGVTIDYSDGSSALEESVETVTETPSSNIQESKPQESVVSPSQDTSTGGAYAVNGKNGKIHIVGGCSATGTGDNAMKDPVYFNTYEDAEAYSVQIKPSLDKRKCGNCW